ncbi:MULTISPECIES: putative sulfate exporter family transporter [unclassified Haladaptatus]|uniref:YeiH family protein n=1 Tax=unclassified Haladaptatus TaxID=2622732 RepID=UPI00209C3602|nr:MULTISPECIES: putative sulfate exporter family transporter [unclassified Haladaptatus]MCO8246661.1 YeiH family protein [Haladaptatus sp. AB643]MCO8256215.1 YeiH family protein [Haladaptatus sp. AB618]
MKRTVVPGIIALLTIGLLARALTSVVPGVNYLIVTILIGLLIGNTYGVPDWARPGVETHKVWLEAGIVVMGASVALDRVVAAGPIILLLVVATVTTTVLLVELLARLVFSIHEETGSLLAAGSGICGVSAVVAIAESIRVEENHIAYAAATVLLFDSTTLFVYPAVGHALGLSSTVFGIWAGLTMFSTGPVTAAGFSFSQTAGQWALLVKLTRNSMIGLAAIAYAVYYARRTGDASDSHDGDVPGGWRFLWRTFPKFVFGFLGVLLVANLGFLSGQQITSLSNASDWAFLLAFAGLGLETRLDELRSTGYKPILVVFLALLVVATAMLFVVQALF